LENLKKNWPHLKNFDDSVLQDATLAELTAMGKQKVSGSRLLSQTLSANFEKIQNFPTNVESGEDDCLGLAHPARFLRGYVGAVVGKVTVIKLLRYVTSYFFK
jgi:hypothetical protein